MNTPRRQGFIFLTTLAVVVVVALLALAAARGVQTRLHWVRAQQAQAQTRQAALGMAMAIAADLQGSWITTPTAASPVGIYPDGHPVGNCRVFLLGHGMADGSTLHFGLLPFAARLNPQSTDTAILAALPGMNNDLAHAIKSAKLEQLDDLRLVNGVEDALFLGEDANENGFLDADEDANRTGQLDGGLRDWLWLGPAMPDAKKAPDGNNLLPVNLIDRRTLDVLVSLFGEMRAKELYCLAVDDAPKDGSLETLRGYYDNTVHNSLELCTRLKLTADEAEKLLPYFKETNTQRKFLIDPYSASRAVLDAACGTDVAGRIAAARPSEPPRSIQWLAGVLKPNEVAALGHQFRQGSLGFYADIVAIRNDGEAFSRLRAAYVFGADGKVRVTHLRQIDEGWPFPWIPLDLLREHLRAGARMGDLLRYPSTTSP